MTPRPTDPRFNRHTQVTCPLDTLPQSIQRSAQWDGLTLIERHHAAGEDGVSVDAGLTGHAVLYNPFGTTYSRQRRDGRDHESPISSDSLNLLPAREAFDWTWSNHRSKPSYHVCLTPDRLSRVGAEAGDLDPDRVHLRHGVNFRDDSLRQCVDLMHRAWRSGEAEGPGGALYMGHLAVVLSIGLLRSYGTRELRPTGGVGRLSRRELDAVREYIEARLAEDVTLEDLADAACLSVFHFLRKFKRTFGQTPHQYLMRRRVERAKVLLRDRAFAERGIAPIAYACGFSDQSHLCRYFKRVVGVTPARWRRDR
ncbi:MAG: AraC family transcriptional regulator [Planctomycetota bacterium]